MFNLYKLTLKCATRIRPFKVRLTISSFTTQHSIHESSINSKQSTNKPNKHRSYYDEIGYPIDQVEIDDHNIMLTFLDNFDRSRDKAEAIRWLKLFTLDLARHFIAEEIVIYPLYRDYIPNGDDIWVKNIEEHWKLKTILTILDPSRPLEELKPLVLDLRQCIDRHFNIEEKDIIPQLIKFVSQQNRIDLSSSFFKRKQIYPIVGNLHVINPDINILLNMWRDPVDKYKYIFFKDQPRDTNKLTYEEYLI
jgi:hypothetical protein